jgi:hypothetical protein
MPTREAFEMTPLVGLLVIVLAAAAIIGLFAGLERWLRRPGLAFILTAISGVIIAGVGIADGKRLIPVLFLVQVPGFVYFAHLRRTEARTESAATPEA